MPVCHKCPRQREIDRLRRICGACAGASAHFGGDVHIDAAENPQTVLVRTDAEYIAESLAAVRGCGYEGAALSWDVMRAPESHLQAIADPAADG